MQGALQTTFPSMMQLLLNANAMLEAFIIVFPIVIRALKLSGK